MNALEVTGLGVEAGGMTVVEGLDLILTSGDKVGVIGRNGAGKTSTLKVLAGEMPASAGTVKRRGAVGYPRQDPRQHRADDGTSGIEYLLAAKGLVDL
ncbi:MAG TPA: ATP-binding cassette domain-containing protein, partial [Actinomycetota bacterium]|nr:ATP-binding cassette domain-containing protein [Actinomycetota bacterium]